MHDIIIIRKRRLARKKEGGSKIGQRSLRPTILLRSDRAGACVSLRGYDHTATGTRNESSNYPRNLVPYIDMLESGCTKMHSSAKNNDTLSVIDTAITEQSLVVWLSLRTRSF